MFSAEGKGRASPLGYHTATPACTRAPPDSPFRPFAPGPAVLWCPALTLPPSAHPPQDTPHADTARGRRCMRDEACEARVHATRAVSLRKKVDSLKGPSFVKSMSSLRLSIPAWCSMHHTRIPTHRRALLVASHQGRHPVPRYSSVHLSFAVASKVSYSAALFAH